LPNHLTIPENEADEVGREQSTTFGHLTEIAKKVEFSSEETPFNILKKDGRYIHQMPSSFDIDTSGEQEYAFVLFHDGENFVIGLVPYDEDKDEESSEDNKEMVFRYQYSPMSASPYSASDDSDSQPSSLPTIVLSYDEIQRTPKRNEETDELYYTVPKQIASLMWFSDGVSSDWAMIGDAAFARIIPKDSQKLAGRVSPDTIPTALPWE
jgi:tetrahydromethanopterin S-methyltransferase subunit G